MAEKKETNYIYSLCKNNPLSAELISALSGLFGLIIKK